MCIAGCTNLPADIDRYFQRSRPGRRQCPFGRDCFYQHIEEDGTPYVFPLGADHYLSVSFPFPSIGPYSPSIELGCSPFFLCLLEDPGTCSCGERISIWYTISARRVRHPPSVIGNCGTPFVSSYHPNVK